MTPSRILAALTAVALFTVSTPSQAQVVLTPAELHALEAQTGVQGITLVTPPKRPGPIFRDNPQPLSDLFISTQSTRLFDLRRALGIDPTSTAFRRGSRGIQSSFVVRNRAAQPATVYRNPFVHEAAVLTPKDLHTTPGSRLYTNQAIGSMPQPKPMPAVEEVIESVPVETVAPEATLTKLSLDNAMTTQVEPGQFLIIPAKGEAVLLEEKR
ncbi:MAG: hypothetical protein AAF797_02570 [Planctomycetota bacterium]